jgi:hypothetical protein
MQLTKNQVQELYNFTKKHYVEWYDLQTELVDHLANDIEIILQQEPNLTFYQARDKAFKKFGIFGFMEVVEQKQNQLTKQYWRLVWKEFKHYITIPKIAFTLSTIYIVYYLLYYIKIHEAFIWSISIILAVVPLIFVLKQRQKLKNKKRKYLFESIVLDLGGLGALLYLPFQIILNSKDFYNQRHAIFISAFMVLYSLLIYTTIVVLPSKVKEIILSRIKY